MNLRSCAVLGLCLSAAPSLLADFTYQETTKITGGSIVSMMKMMSAFSSKVRQVGEPRTVTVYLKGNRMARVSPETTEIVELDAETITNIDNKDHTYTVMTFEQMKQQIEAARKELEKKSAEHATGTSKPSDQNVDMSFKVNVRQTGAKKELSGVDTSEAILSMQMIATDQTSGQSGAMAITNDMWMAAEIPGYAELRDFEMRFAAKMGTVLGGGLSPSLMAMNPGVGQGMADMVKEMSKLKGVPVLQVTRVGSTSNGEPLPAASEAPLPPQPDGPSGGDLAKAAATDAANNSANAAANAGTSAAASHMGVMGSAMSGMGGFGGFGKKKKADPPPAAAAPSDAATPTSAVLIESSTEMAGFSSAGVDGSHFSIPAGFKQVQPKEHQMQ
jgi:hypothetical protein